MTFYGPVINQSACGIYLSHIIIYIIRLHNCSLIFGVACLAAKVSVQHKYKLPGPDLVQ